MDLHAPSAARHSPSRAKAWWLVAVALALAAALWWHGPIPQWAGYHDFADDRSLAGLLPNAADVQSNLPFAVIAAWAAARLRPTPADAAAWWAFVGALFCTAAGSALYHWAPDNAALVWDRLPIACACAALSCAFLSERVGDRFGHPAVVAVALLLAAASVALWHASEARGESDLRAYLFVQFLPVVLVPAGLLMRLGTGRRDTVPAAGWWGVLGAYGLAKLCELGDAPVVEATGWVSGHTLKHLFAAAGAAVLLAAKINSGSRR